MHGTQKLLIYLAVGCSIATCAHNPKPTSQFYQNKQVRTCLEIDKQHHPIESRACWTKLERKLATNPDFRQSSRLTAADVSKIQALATVHDQGAKTLQHEMERCLSLPIEKRQDRIECLRGFYQRHADSLSLSEKLEIDNTISAMIEADQLATGQIEATIEHTGKLLGARLHQEESGIRIDALHPGCLQQAGVKEQSLIAAIADVSAADLSPLERIAHLNACREKPVRLLVRYGDLDGTMFSSVSIHCGEKPECTTLRKTHLAHGTCSKADSPEIRLGLSWCYVAEEGTLRVEQVCAGSPAALAGIYPEQKFTGMNGVAIMGKTKEQIDRLLQQFFGQPVRFDQKSGSLLSPDTLKTPVLTLAQTNACWQAIEATRLRHGVTQAP